MRAQRLALLTCLFMLTCETIRSAVVYSNFGVNDPDGSGGGYGLGSGRGIPFGGFYGVAVPFVPSWNCMLDSVRIPITVFTNAPDNQFAIELRSGPTTPDSVLETHSIILSGFTVLELNSALHSHLKAGTKYWVTVLMASAGGEWGWGSPEHPMGEVWVLTTPSALWSNAFASSWYVPGLEVSGTPANVPEPSAAAMMLGLGVASVLVRRRA